ncbi:MAG: hypothetical protein ACMUJM_20180 [bacterium]
MTWPNILALEYMLQTNQINPEIEMKAREYINIGYQRLLTFECVSGGFGWYGDTCEPILTAYGLMMFADMARVHYVDPALINRTQEWLIVRQERAGSWPPDKNRHHFNRLDNSLQSTAYVMWALIHSGYSKNASQILKAGEYIKANMEESNDIYTLALCVNALLEADPKDSAALSVLDYLQTHAIAEEDNVYWSAEGESVTYSRGSYLNLETTAMITMALIKGGWQYPQSINGALNYIIEQKEARGHWGQTQATVLSLRVFMMSLFSTNTSEEPEGEIIITINDKTLDKNDMPILKITPIDTSILRLIDLTPFTLDRENTVSVNLRGEGNLLYQIVGTYFLPWGEVFIPQDPPLVIDVAYDRTMLTVDDIITCTVTVTNTIPESVTKIGMIDLGISPGFRIFWEDFEQAIEEGKIFKYESTNRQLSLYLHPVYYKEPLTITYRMQAKYPLKVSTPKSVAYDYYNPNLKGETKPITLTVTE